MIRLVDSLISTRYFEMLLLSVNKEKNAPAKKKMKEINASSEGLQLKCRKR